MTIRLKADFSSETMKIRGSGMIHANAKIKKKSCQPRILQAAKLFFKNEGEIKTFPDKQRLREFTTSRPPLLEILMEVPRGERI